MVFLKNLLIHDFQTFTSTSESRQSTFHQYTYSFKHRSLYFLYLFPYICYKAIETESYADENNSVWPLTIDRALRSILKL